MSALWLYLFLSVHSLTFWYTTCCDALPYLGDRQLQVYGSRPSNGTTSPARSSMHSTATSNQQQQHQQQSTAESTSSVHSNGRNEKPSTPQNTPAGENVNQNNDGNNNMSNNDQGDNNDNSGDNGVLLCPRGLAAIPLLCAAASESRSAYLARLQVTHPSNGVSTMAWIGRGMICLLDSFTHLRTCIFFAFIHATTLQTTNQTTLDIILIFSGGLSKNHSVSK